MVYINTTGKHNEVWLDKPYATITVECPDCPSTEDAYSSGWTDGSEDGYHKGYQSGSTDGWSDGYPSGYTDGYGSGYTDGLSACSGGSCEEEWQDGYDSGYTDGSNSVDCTDFYNSGVTDGIAEQKAKMIPLSVTQNDYVFRREDGYNEVEVHVPINLQRKYLDLTSEDFEDWGNEYRAKSGNSFAFEVRPDYDYTGLGRVSVTARVSVVPALNKGYNSGYTAGYDSGYTDGLNACSGGNEDLIANLQGDYFVIPEGTTKLRNYAFYRGYHTDESVLSAITIPSSVTEIGNYVFNNWDLTGITIPSSVQTIGDSAFEFAFSKEINTEIVIPDTVQSIGQGAFANNICLTAATLPSGLTAIPASLFYNARLTGITLPRGITSIGNSAFNSNPLTGNIVIPSGVTEIGRSAFQNVSGLTSMTFKSSVPADISTSNFNASLGSSAYTWPIYVPCEAVDTYKTAWPYYAHRIMCDSGYTPATSITLNADSAITGTGQTTVTVNPSDAETDITYTSSNPSKATIDENGVITVVGDGNVTFCAIDAISQLQDCKTVNVTADSGSGVYLAGMYYVTSTTEPTQILTRNYGHDILLDKMEYPLGQSRETSNYFTFPATGMQTVYFYFKDPATIPDKTFSGVTQLVGVNIPSVVNKIGDGAFRETSLTEVTIPSGVSLADYAFTRIPTLTAVTLGEGLSFSGGMECFSRTPITSITFPQSISAAPSHVLYNCSALTNVVFNGTLERLGDAAFGNCTALRNYVLPSSVTFIGENCFVGIPNIGSITLLRTTPAPLDDGTTSLGYTTETFPIYVPAGSVEAYKAEYLNYASRIQAIP